MGSTKDIEKKAAAIDLHAELPITPLPPEQLTPEIRALYEKMMQDPSPTLTSNQEEILRTHGPMMRQGTPVTDALRAWLKSATPEQIKQFADGGNALAAGLRAASEVKAEESKDLSAGLVDYATFQRTDIRVGEIKQVSGVPKSDKLWNLTVDLGELGTRTICAGIRKSYPDPESLKALRCAFVVNLPPRKMMGIESNGMALAAPSGVDDKVVLVLCNGKPGSRLG